MRAKDILELPQSTRQRKFKRQRDFLGFIIAILLILGVFFRFTNLDTKVYWGDETVTSLRISGHTLGELKQLAFRGEEISTAQMQQYQYPNPEKNVLDTIKGLAAEEPQHPPLYFVLAKIWVQLFGNSAAVTRSFSAIISLLSFPCVYWLTQELFKSPLTGWIAVALMAVSPFHVLYAQEARSNSLWTVTILLSSAALLRARRLQTNASWRLYTLSLVIGFYTFILSGAIAIAHGIYLFINEGFKLTKTVRNYLIALAVSLLLFFPWIVAVLSNFSEANATTNWTAVKVSLKSLVKTWLLNLSRPFVDFNYNFVTRNLLMYAVIFLLVILVGYSIYFLCRHTQQRVWLFILTLIGGTAFILIVPDLVSGGMRSSVARYAIPCFLGIQIAVAYLLASQLTSIATSPWQQQLWRIVTVVLISGGIASCAVSSQARVWWNKYNAATLPQVVSVVNQSSNPVFVTSWHGLMVFSHAFHPQVRLQPLEGQPISIQEEGNRAIEIFVYESSKALKALMETKPGYRIDRVYEWKKQIEPVYEIKTTLWKLTK
jgi:uncharacterized membrane protein